jgi:hypothetical protein
MRASDSFPFLTWSHFRSREGFYSASKMRWLEEVLGGLNANGAEDRIAAGCPHFRTI